MTLSASILITGAEVTEGRIQDTNSKFMLEKLHALGIEIKHILACDDIQSEIEKSIKFLLDCSTILIISGGIGPTDDDLTREAVAQFCGQKLKTNETAKSAMEALYAARKRQISPSNYKQTLIPEGAELIPNPLGTAAGFSISTKIQNTTHHLFILPGVPWELYRMFDEMVLPKIGALLPDKGVFKEHTLRVFGLPESVVGERVKSCAIDSKVKVSYRAAFPEIQVKLLCRTNEFDFPHAIEQVRESLGREYVFSEAPELGLAQIVQELLLKQGATLAVAESCTAGLLGSILTETPGSSAVFLGGITSYSNDAKTWALCVDTELIKTHGAVSEAVACAMAEGARNRFSAAYALSITGIAGPGGGSEAKPVGTFYIGLANARETFAKHFYFNSERKRIREYAAHCALDLLRRKLLGL